MIDSGIKDLPRNEHQIANDIYEFLLEFQKSFPVFNEKKDFFITGESYAGHYLPNLAHFLLEKANPKLNLKGVAIGNGMASPKLQYPSF